ncbi:MAG: hypothetical protein JNM12_09945 [Alphaproteobacteria bacterium]|nr:hypothetical protein [Alphaproteobacteria bacterium]
MSKPQRATSTDKPAPRLYDMDKVIIDLKNNPLQVEGKDLTIGDAIVSVLVANTPGEGNGKQKLDRYQLGVRLNEGGPQPLTHEEIVLIKELIAKPYGPIVVGQVYEALEN